MHEAYMKRLSCSVEAMRFFVSLKMCLSFSWLFKVIEHYTGHVSVLYHYNVMSYCQ